MTRRRILKAGTLLTGLTAAASPWPFAGRAQALGQEAPASRRIALLNLHTGEQLEVEYFRDFNYVDDALAAIDGLLRDFRSGESHAMDPQLMDYLVEVAARVGAPPSFSVISGYRSPATNQHLHERSNGVSTRSLHMEGRAIDVRILAIDCADLAAGARSLERGGVGYYRASNFVHLDTGAFRTWRG